MITDARKAEIERLSEITLNTAGLGYIPIDFNRIFKYYGWKAKILNNEIRSMQGFDYDTFVLGIKEKESFRYMVFFEESLPKQMIRDDIAYYTGLILLGGAYADKEEAKKITEEAEYFAKIFLSSEVKADVL